MLDANNNASKEENSDNSQPIVENLSQEKLEETSEIPVQISNEAVNEIESKLAENSEKQIHKALELGTYNNFSLEDLVAELDKLLNENSVQSIHSNVAKIKSAFNVKFGELLRNEKKLFIDAGGNSLDFHFENPVKAKYNGLLYDYKIKKSEYFTKQENELSENLKLKTALIEELKHLVDGTEGEIKFNAFKIIQDKWRAIGPVPKEKYNDTWRTYQHHVERFYDLLHLNNDLRDLDFKHNYEEKLNLVIKAEALTELSDINVAFKELQILHKLWKEDIGPVSRENREEIWNRFSAATKIIHDKKHHLYQELKSKNEDNIDLKLAVISEIEKINDSNKKTRIDWQKSMNEIEELRNKFFKIGQVPKSKNELIWTKFKNACHKFNSGKNDFYKNIKNDHLDNLNKKKLLIAQADSLKDSEEWDSTTEVMKKIQSDWKNIGHVPRKYSDKLWKDFKDACNHYFDRLHNKLDAGKEEQLEVFNEKKELLKEIKKVSDSNEDISLDSLKEYVNDWRELGDVPKEMKHIEAKFNKLIDKIVDESDIDTKDVEMIKFETLINSYLSQKNYRKLDSEQLFVRKKIDETTREIHQLENNIGFISNVKEDNPLIKNVRDQINTFKSKLALWKNKLEYLKKIDY
ncbi:DUF349 domain-containing protein [Lutibacter sp.]|uniref:DUF349 domain-containing protein n=1 Tax=Lutibacter sp. TaxID=1925666 RepID=UPI002736B66C|nr:DUF349 domain-containing protein [Lutibacter sp.]MDP3312183.1 DUF349 domain-containing protein [Lutibacter sp.]